MTDDRLAALAARRTKQDRHPARSARVLVAGVSVSALASLVSAFTVQAAINTPASTDDAVDSLNTIDPNAATVAPPTMPAPAAPAVVRHVVDVANATPTPQPVAPVEQTLTGGTDLSKYASGGSSGGGSGGSSGGSTGGGTTGGSTGGGGSSGGSRGSR